MSAPVVPRPVLFSGDFNDYVRAATAAGHLVVQPRMGMADPQDMRAGLGAVAVSDATVACTLTLDSYTRVGDEWSARRAVENHLPLNGYPITVLPVETTRDVVTGSRGLPVQVRHGSAKPARIFAAMIDNGLGISEGGPVSYCLPYGRVPLTESVAAWKDATAMFAAAPGVSHLETFGGCMLGQLCPPSMLVAISTLEAMFFAEHGIRSLSLSYAQQTHADQDIGALRALNTLAAELLPADVSHHLVMYTYMGVYPATNDGAGLLLGQSAISAVRGGAGRLIVKTAAESRRIPTVAENVAALESAALIAAGQHAELGGIPLADQLWTPDAEEILDEARTLVGAVLEEGVDVGSALVAAFRRGVLDIPYCLHADNNREAEGFIDTDGRLRWAVTGKLPLARSAPREPVRSDELLGMLNTVAGIADADGQALRQRVDGERAATPVGPGVDGDNGSRLRRTVIIGSGPRGIAVLERLAVRLRDQESPEPHEIVLVDAVEVGCGRIWRTDQSPHLLMNTVAGEVTLFSGPPADDDTAAPGAGPSLAQWWAALGDPEAGINEFAPRALHGRYLRFVVDTVATALPAGCRLRRITGTVTGIEGASEQGTDHPEGPRRLVGLAPGARELADRNHPDANLAPDAISADYIVLTTGHARHSAGPHWLEVTEGTRTRVLPADCVADLPLDDVGPGQTVGALGLGLSFYDLVAVLTLGRGGEYYRDGDVLHYRPSGREPRIIGGSRSGVPMLARGFNQKATDFHYQPRLFTTDRMHALRARKGRLTFDKDVWPWLNAEMTLVHHETYARIHDRPEMAEALRHCIEDVESADDALENMRRLATEAGLPAEEDVHLEQLRSPFRGRTFVDADDFRSVLVQFIQHDLAQAKQGNVGNPLKACLDVMRDTRPAVRAAVDFGGLTSESFIDELLGWFNPLSAALAAGPPLVRLEELLALMEAGVVDIVGPGASFVQGEDRAEICSGQVGGPGIPLDFAVDARVPPPNLATDASPLTESLMKTGTITPYLNDGQGSTGGVHITTSPFHPIGADGEPDRQLSVLGIPTEFVRWFTQVGSGRPGHWGDFVADADDIAVAALGRVDASTEPASAEDVIDPDRLEGNEAEEVAAAVLGDDESELTKEAPAWSAG